MEEKQKRKIIDWTLAALILFVTVNLYTGYYSADIVDCNLWRCKFITIHNPDKLNSIGCFQIDISENIGSDIEFIEYKEKENEQVMQILSEYSAYY